VIYSNSASDNHRAPDVVANIVQPGRFLVVVRGLMFHTREREADGLRCWFRPPARMSRPQSLLRANALHRA